MSTVDLVAKIEKLPAEKQVEVADFVEFLLVKTQNKTEKKTRKFGSGKGMITFLSKDFDAPLADLKDYM